MAAIPIIGAVVGKVLDRVLPDKAANDAAKATLAQMQLNGELQQITGQLAINLAEAQSQSVFVAGWRPAVGWACAFAFAYSYILQPFLCFALVALGHGQVVAQVPHVDLATMMPVMLGMLGLGAMRSYDKSIGQSGGT